MTYHRKFNILLLIAIYADDATLSTSVDIATGLTSIESQLQNDTDQLVKRSDENTKTV